MLLGWRKYSHPVAVPPMASSSTVMKFLNFSPYCMIQFPARASPAWQSAKKATARAGKSLTIPGKPLRHPGPAEPAVRTGSVG